MVCDKEDLLHSLEPEDLQLGKHRKYSQIVLMEEVVEFL